MYVSVFLRKKCMPRILKSRNFYVVNSNGRNTVLLFCTVFDFNFALLDMHIRILSYLNIYCIDYMENYIIRQNQSKSGNRPLFANSLILLTYSGEYE